MFINENQKKWTSIITEELGISDRNKLDWMSQLASIHEIKEGLQSNGTAVSGIYTTPLNTIGMGNPMMPAGTGFTQGGGIGNTGTDFHNTGYKVGSGDQLPMSTLAMAMTIAAITIGLELVPVIVSQGPWQMLTYMDFPYAGGKLGRINETSMDGKGPGNENKPIYIKVSAGKQAMRNARSGLVKDAVTIIPSTNSDTEKYTFNGKFVGNSRIDNNIIVEVTSVIKETGTTDSSTSVFTATSTENISIADFFDLTGAVYTLTGKDAAGDSKVIDLTSSKDTGVVRPELVATMSDHILGFSNFATGVDEPMTRAENETGVGNTIGARMFSKMVQMGSLEVTGSVTRQQLQDMPLYGVDVIGKVLESMQNEISQGINKLILDRVFKLGVTNAALQKDIQGVDLNLYLSNSATSTSKTVTELLGGASSASPSKYVNILGEDLGKWRIFNASSMASAENIMTHQRRIASRVLAASNVIAQVSRRGRANWIVTNTQIATALQDNAGFVIAPMINTLSQDGSQSLYFSGSIGGLNVYVDPYMDWNDTRVCVGRKGDGNTPGVIFMPYILADTIQTIVEGTMAPKLLVNSRFAIVDAGFNPEFNYYTFVVGSDSSSLYV